MLDSQRNENESASKEKLTQILTSLNELKDHIHSLDDRISHLEGNYDKSKPIVATSSSSSSDTVQKTDFDNLDEHLKRTYKYIVNAQEPLTASDIAEQMGRSRSTISYHLNRLKELDLLEKVASDDPDRSRNVFFRTKDREFR